MPTNECPSPPDEAPETVATVETVHESGPAVPRARRTKIGVNLLIAALVLLGCVLLGARAYRQLSLAGWQTLSTDEVSFRYPPGWEQADAEILYNMGPFVQAMVYEPTQGAFATNVNLVVEATPGMTMSAKEYASHAIATYATQGQEFGIDRYEFIRQKALRLGSTDSHMIYGELVVSGTTLPLRNFQLVVPCGERFFVLTGTCMKGDWEDNEAVFDKIAKSFRSK